MAKHFLHHRSTWSGGGWSDDDVASMIATVDTLKQAALAGRPMRALEGRNLALLLGQAVHGGPDRLCRAATELGARVVRLYLGEMPLGADHGRSLFRLLGRLYDAIDCYGAAPQVVEDIEREAGVPVLDGLAADDHPMRALADLIQLRDSAGKALRGLRIGYGGELRSPRGLALRSLAERTGMTLQAAGSTGCVFDGYIDATGPAHWRYDFAGAASDEAGAARQHHYTVQALLILVVV